MENKAKTSKDYYSIDLMHIARSLVHRLWIIILAAVLAATAGFAYSAFVIPPSYGSNVLLYVNNSTLNLGNAGLSISASDLQASLSLVNTYSVLLKNRTTLKLVLENSGLKDKYTVEQLAGMITTSSVNETEVMEVLVVCNDPHDAQKLAKSVSEVLPGVIERIIEGASMKIVDEAVVPKEPIGPSVSRFTILGLIIGALAATIIIAIVAIMDDTIYNEDYVLENYNYPILAKVPNLLETHRDSSYGYYYKSASEQNE